MNLHFEHEGRRYSAAAANAASIAIPLDFDGPQPNHFGARRGTRETLELDGFVGRTKRGGSCNVDVLRLTPHCNGTHTETVSHIVDEDIWIGKTALEPLAVAVLVSIPLISATCTEETYQPRLDATDSVITGTSLREACASVPLARPTALIIRTLPNEEAKQVRAYSRDDAPAFLTIDAMRFIVNLGCRHLLVDLPSVDKMHDDGWLTNHHLFWNVPERSHSLTAESWTDKTITEMVFVDNELDDGVYLLSLQIPALCSDAAPSRPVIIPATLDYD